MITCRIYVREKILRNKSCNKVLLFILILWAQARKEGQLSKKRLSGAAQLSCNRYHKNLRKSNLPIHEAFLGPVLFIPHRKSQICKTEWIQRKLFWQVLPILPFAGTAIKKLDFCTSFPTTVGGNVSDSMQTPYISIEIIKRRNT